MRSWRRSSLAELTANRSFPPAIAKKGNRYLRKMLVVGCTSVLRAPHKHKGALAEWIVAMRARKPERVVAVALANKLARIAWAMMSTGESFRTELYTKA
jgi:transposase